MYIRKSRRTPKVRRQNYYAVALNSSLANRAEGCDLLSNLSLDSLEAGSEKLSGVEALALKVLALFDVLSCSFLEYELALGINIDLSNAEGDRLLDHIVRDTCAAVENEGHIACLSLDSLENVEAETGPVCRVLAVDIADACCEHCNAEVCNSLALVGISALAHTNNAVFLAADGTDLSLKRKAENIAGIYKSGCLGNVLLDRIVRTVEHNGREACVDASLCALKGAVVEVKSNGNGDIERIEHTVYHTYNSLVAAHILACALGNTEDNGRLQLLNSLKNCLCPLEVVDVDLSNSILAVTSLDKHILSRN